MPDKGELALTQHITPNGELNKSSNQNSTQLPPGMVATIQETLSRIAASLDLQEVLRTIAENARRLVGSDISQVNLYDRETGRVWVGTRDDGRPEQPASPPTPPRPDGLTMQVIRQSAPVIVQNILSHPLFVGYKPAQQWGIRTLAGFPIKREEVAVGVLMVAFVCPHRLGQRERNALELLASQAAVAIENSRLYAAEQKRVAQLALINEISQQIAGLMPVDELLDRAAHLIQARFDYHHVALFLVDRQAGQAAVKAMAGDYGSYLPQDHHLSLGSGLVGWTAAHGETLLANDVAKDARYIASIPHTRSELCLSLKLAGETIGVLDIQSPRLNAFDQVDAQAMGALAGQLAVAIENVRLFEAEQERRQIAEALSQTASILTSTLDVDKVLELVLDSLRSVVAYDSSAVFLRQNDRLELTAGRGFPESARTDGFSFDITDSALEPILTEEGQPMVIPDVSVAERFRAAEGTEYIRSWIGAPLWARGKLVGLLSVDHSQPEMYDEKDARKVMDFANQAAIVIENARLHAAVQVHAEELEWRVKDRTAELRHEKEKTEAILRSVADGVVVAGLDGEILLANPVAARWLTLEVNGQPAPNRPLWQFIAQLAQVTEVEKVHRTEFLLGPDKVILEAHAARLFEDGVALGIVAVLRDVTRQQELERLKSQFIASVSHELRTPLANVKLYLSLLQRGKKEKRARYLKVATEEAGRLEELIQDLLDFSRLDVASDRQGYEPLNLEEIARQAMPPYLSRADSQGLVIVKHFAPSLPPVLGDRHQITRILSNLLDNALNYTSAGGKVTVELRPLVVKAGYCAGVSGPGVDEAKGLKVPDVPDGEWVGVIVADTGIGILPEDLPYIFERFYRGGQLETMSLPGAGLGLPLVRELLNRHGGYIAVSSAAGEGSVFVAFLPGHSGEA